MVWRWRQHGQYLRTLLIPTRQKARAGHAGSHRLLTTQAIADWKHVQLPVQKDTGQATRPMSSSSRQWYHPSSIEDIREAIYDLNADVHFRSGNILPGRTDKSTHSVKSEQLFRWIGDWPRSFPADHRAWAHRIVTQLVTSREEGLDFVKEWTNVYDLFGKFRTKQIREDHSLVMDNSVSTDALRFYNALVSRLDQLQVPLPRHARIRGVFYAAEGRSTAAMKHYLQASSELGRELKGIFWIPYVLHSINRWVKTDSFTGWEGIRQRQELLVIMSGWKEMGVKGPDEIRQKCIHNLIPTSLQPAYLSILRKLSNADAVFDHWLYFKSTELYVTLPPESKDFEHLRNRILKAFVCNLIEADDPKRAWQVAEESGSRLDDFGESTVDALLEHPEFIGKWKDGMSGLMLRKFDEYLSRIEQSLAVRWSGGEDGFHLPLGD